MKQKQQAQPLAVFLLFFSAAVDVVEAVVVVATALLFFSATLFIRATVFFVGFCAERIFFFALFAALLAYLLNLFHSCAVHGSRKLLVVHNLIFEQEFDDKVELGAIFGKNTLCVRICSVDNLLYLLVDKRGGLLRIILRRIEISAEENLIA